jgi:NADPH:quinone reductase-like Zn-dependent oxidoreductase
VATSSGQTLSALIDTVGHGYVALGVELGIAPERIDTVADQAAAERYGTRSDGGQAAATVTVVSELVRLIVAAELELPIARTFPLDEVRDAYTLLESGHQPGKIVLIP